MGTLPSRPQNELQQRRDARRVIAGKEPGCLFYCLFHTGFVGASTQLHVPLAMMDRAFKNKQGQYKPEGEATLTFSLSTQGSTPTPPLTSAETAEAMPVGDTAAFRCSSV